MSFVSVTSDLQFVLTCWGWGMCFSAILMLKSGKILLFFFSIGCRMEDSTFCADEQANSFMMSSFNLWRNEVWRLLFYLQHMMVLNVIALILKTESLVTAELDICLQQQLLYSSLLLLVALHFIYERTKWALETGFTSQYLNWFCSGMLSTN